MAAEPHTCPQCGATLPFRWYLLPASLHESELSSKVCPSCRSRLGLRYGPGVVGGAVATALVVIVVTIAAAEQLGLPLAAFVGVVGGGLLGAVAATAVVYRFGSLELRIVGDAAAARDKGAPAPPEGRTEPQAPPYDDALLQQRAVELEQRYEYAAASYEVLLDDDLFTNAVSELARSRPPIDELQRLGRDNRYWISRIALGVMAERDDVPAKWRSTAIRRLTPAAYDHAGLFLASLSRVPGEVIGPALSKTDDVLGEDLVRLIQHRIAGGYETFDAERARKNVAASLRPSIEALLDEHREELPASVVDALGEWLHGQLDLGPELGSAVTSWAPPFLEGSVFLDAQRQRVAAELTETLRAEPGASAILIGEPGVGKTTVVRKALADAGPGWSAFEATASALNAGAMWVGQLEGRVEDLVSRLDGKRVVWVFPDFQDALFAGAFVGDPRGLLDALLLHVEAGRLRLVAELTPQAYELLVSRRPRVVSAFKTLRLHPLDVPATLEVCQSVAREDLALVVRDEVVRETIEYAGQFLPGLAHPGAALKLLKAVAAYVREAERSEIESSDVLATLSTLTGIPTEILDPSRPLGLERVEAFLSHRVLGQKKAVEALVERIALVKAGLTDPTRPLGVFLFVGPTGTGKTELAKALAELVFGSSSRLLRLDMSEYQTPDSLERLLSDANVEPTASPLIAAVRRDPFSVILLDEFEKAAPPIHDLFLQLFDDGRLTDRSGQVCDFRHCMVILTSNVGSALRHGPGLGFDLQSEPFHAGTVERALERAFRPEFLNRIDRVLVFRPFEREQMRALLEKEIDDVRRRRGLRDRPWAIELDASASEFLIERGFSPTLGARPLKRAVEQHVLTPLARAIADARVPTGDQFLFLSAKNGKIAVEFVGLESDDGTAVDDAPLADEEAAGDDGQLLRIVRGGIRRRDDRVLLFSLLERVESQVAQVVAPRKDLLLAELGRDGFWEGAERHGILAEIEYLDRLEAATKTARRLGERLRTSETERAQADVGDLLAVRLHVLSQALAGLEVGAPFDVVVRIRLLSEADGEPRALSFLEQLERMYGSWAERRGMNVETLAETDGERMYLVSGLGAGAILAAEAGVHVLEIVEGDGRDGKAVVERVSVSVQVAAAPSSDEREAQLLDRARAAVDEAEHAGRVVRRYRLEPDGLVRDAVRGYRTGRVERVLAGDFDLYTSG